jgi:GNAT superfamily N-acetyltransferase
MAEDTLTDAVPAGDLAYRPARADDSDAIAVLLGQLGYPASASEIPARLAALADYPNALTLVAADRGEVVGIVTAHVFPSLHVAEPVAWITSMVVSEEHRSRGIGSELIERAERWAVEKGAVKVALTSALHREDAHAFYEKKQRYEKTGLRFSKGLANARAASR